MAIDGCGIAIAPDEFVTGGNAAFRTAAKALRGERVTPFVFFGTCYSKGVEEWFP
jgi:hypothetical protein